MRKLIAVLIATLLLAGCTSLPTDGPVQSARPQIPAGYGVDVLAQGPALDAEPGDIVEGFLRASAYGHADDFAIASEFLATGVNWNPLARVRVFSADKSPVYSTAADGGISVTVDQIALVDELGRYRLSEVQSLSAQYTLVRNADNQWRIASLDDGLLVSDVNFRQTFAASSLHFLTHDFTATVPEIRWYPLEGRMEHAVEGLLSGPSGWTETGVTTAFPAGTDLGGGGITTRDGVVSVDFSAEMLTATPQQLALAQAQLSATLSGMGELGGVALSVGGDELNPPDSALDLALPTPAAGPVFLTNGQLARYTSAETAAPIPGMPDLSARSPRDPAIPFEGVDAPRVVIADGGTNLLALPENAEPYVVLTGVDLVAPSIDRYGWIWSSPAQSGGLLIAKQANGSEARIEVPWLAGRTLTQFRVAADGARAVVVSQIGAATFVELVAIGRDGVGRPRTLGERVRIADSMDRVIDISWVDQTNLMVLGATMKEVPNRVYRVTIGGTITVLPAIEDAISLASGRNDRSVVVVSADGYLHVRSGAGWRLVLTGVVDPAFSG